MKSFLQETAQDIIENHSSKLPTTALIFPNKRTGYFFKKYFGEISKKTVWSPDVFTMGEIIKFFTKLKTPDRLSLLFDLFECYVEAGKRLKLEQQDWEKEDINLSFDKFYSLGEIILSDISDIDNYLTNVNQVFSNIKDIREIESEFAYLTEEEKEILRNFWRSFSSEKESIEKKKFVELWKRMPVVYDLFTKKLLKNNLAYEGLVYRKMADLVTEKNLHTGKYQHFIFVGFNALNKAQRQLFTYLHKEKKATFYWDADKYYVNDFKQEAGDFIRQNFKDLEQKTDTLPSFIKNTKKNIQLISVPLEIGQAKSVTKLLEHHLKNKEKGEEKTAVVLSDEDMLFPVLHSLPNCVEKVNVTMGYPFKDTLIYGLLMQYLKLQRSIKIKNEIDYSFYYKDIISLLRQPLIWNKNAKIASKLLKDIQENNKIYIKHEALKNSGEQILDLIFTPISKGNELIKSILNILYILFVSNQKNKKEDETSIEDEYIYQVYIQIKRLSEILENKIPNYSFAIATKLLQQLWAGIRIPFSGEPLRGVQLMGMLETRNLDFKNLIILGMNEGIMPNISKKPSFIPENLRIAFGLPCQKQQDAIFAYYFYRLLQRAENITLIYNSITGANSGELSRFVQQLKYESGFNIIEKEFKQDLVPAVKKEIVIEKTPEIMQILDNYKINSSYKRYFSASGINTFINCSLKFYFQYIAKLKAPQQVEEEITPLVFGNILHSALEMLYGDFIIEKKYQTIENSDFNTLENRIDKYIKKAFSKYYNKNNENEFQYEGSHFIVKEVIKKHIIAVLKVDRKHAPFDLIAVESSDFKGKIQITSNDETFSVGIRGIIDRIDCKDNIFRLLDYKSGSANKSYKDFESVFDSKNKTRNSIIIQMYLYGVLFYQEQANLGKLVVPTIYDIRKMSDNSFKPYLEQKIDRKQYDVDYQYFKKEIPKFEEELKKCLSDLFNEEIPFYQTENESICEYCPYTSICSK